MNRMIALGAIASALCGAPASARTDDRIVHKEIISYADLNLGDEHGQKELARRLHIAISKVCGDSSQADLAGSNAVRRCHNRLHQKAKASLRSVSGAQQMVFTYHATE